MGAELRHIVAHIRQDALSDEIHLVQIVAEFRRPADVVQQRLVALEVGVQRVHYVAHGVLLFVKHQLFHGAQGVGHIGDADHAHGEGDVGRSAALIAVQSPLHARLVQGGQQHAGVLGKGLEVGVLVDDLHPQTCFLLRLVGLQQLLEGLEAPGVAGAGSQLLTDHAAAAVVQRQLQAQAGVAGAGAGVAGVVGHRGIVAAGGDIVPCPLQRHAQIEHGLDGGLVCHEFQLAVELFGRLHGVLHIGAGVETVDAHHHVLGAQSHVALGVQQHVGHLVDGVPPIRRDAAHTQGLHGGVSAFAIGHHIGLQVDAAVHLDEQQAQQIMDFLVRDASRLHVPPVVGVQVLVGPAKGGACAPALDHDGHIHQPNGLNGLEERVGGEFRHLAAGIGDPLQLRPPACVAGLFRQLRSQRRVAVGELDDALVGDLGGQPELPLVLRLRVGGVVQPVDMLLRLPDDGAAAHGQQLFIVGGGMRPVVAVLRIAAGGHHDVIQPLDLRRHLLLPVLKAGLPHPVGQVAAQVGDLLLTEGLVFVKGTGGQGVQLVQQPLAAELGVDGAAAGLGCEVAREQLTVIDADVHVGQDVAQGLGPAHFRGLTLRLHIGLGHIAQALGADGGIGHHCVTQSLTSG